MIDNVLGNIDLLMDKLIVRPYSVSLIEMFTALISIVIGI